MQNKTEIAILTSPNLAADDFRSEKAAMSVMSLKNISLTGYKSRLLL